MIFKGWPMLLGVLILAGCASFSDGSGQTGQWGHVATYQEACSNPGANCPTLRSQLCHVPGLRWLFCSVPLGPCLPATDQGTPQPCGGWPVLPAAGHVREAQETAYHERHPKGSSSPATSDGGSSATTNPAMNGRCAQPSPGRLADFFLWLASRQTHSAVEQGGAW